MKVAGHLSAMRKSGRYLGEHNKLFENLDGQEIQRSFGRKLDGPKLLKWAVQFSV